MAGISRTLLIACALALATATSATAAPLKVVASFSILGDMVAQVGGDLVTVRTLVGPDGDAHVYQPTPGDAQGVAGAGLVVVNGLGFEGWLNRLVGAAGYRGRVVTATSGITAQTMVEEDEESGVTRPGRKVVTPRRIEDPHAWQDLRNGIVYIGNIAEGLAAADPANAATYRARAQAYQSELKALDAWVRATLEPIPADRRKVITGHDAFGYFANAYGVMFVAPVGISTEAEPTASDVARLIRQIRQEHIKALFVENMTDPRLIEQIGRETGAQLGGTLYADALSGPSGPAPTYVAMFRHNATLLSAAMNRN
jgi:zinc/manganese transport system substrate-binding protein